MTTDTQIPNHVQERHSPVVVSSELAAVPEQLFEPKFRWYAVIRPGLDFLLGLMLLTCLSPVIIGGAVAVKLTSPGPAFYCQTRLGRNGRKFTIVKLRTMVNNAEALTGPVWAASNDPRTTRLGRFLRNTHIDEFPQLFNVVTGQMGLIGPRPERPEIAESLEWEIPHFHQRLQVRPGITGLSQLVLPADSDIEDVRRKFLSDVYYIRNMNPLLDAQVGVYTLTYLVSASWSGLRRFTSLPGLGRIEQKLASECGADTVEELYGKINRNRSNL